MPQFQLLAQPLWVNLLLLIPLALFSAGEASSLLTASRHSDHLRTPLHLGTVAYRALKSGASLHYQTARC
jgi:hypothetical protein